MKQSGPNVMVGFCMRVDVGQWSQIEAEDRLVESWNYPSAL
jgi:hypothetical protein